MTYISHRNIPENTIEARGYQTTIAKEALTGNTLVVLPTGMGKTAVALLVAAERIDEGKVLMLAPTKPLVEQHFRYFSHNLLLKQEDIAMFTGSNQPEKRVKLWNSSRFVVATPEVIRNDLVEGRYVLDDISLLIVDECHRAVGNYAYVPITEIYNQSAKNPLVLGMTASPGYDKEHVAEICDHLAIQHTEIRTEDDEDVQPYIHEREIDTVLLDLPEELWLSVSALNSMIDDCLSQLSGMHYKTPRREMLSMNALNAVMAQIQVRKNTGDKSSFTAMSIHAEIMKLRHGVVLAESQGSTAFKVYLEKLESEVAEPKPSKSTKNIVSDARFQKVLAMTQTWKEELHPKAAAVARVIQEQLVSSPESRIIVFVSYRDSVNMLVNYLNNAGISARRFVGQASRDEEKGLSQKKQIEAIKQFREGEYPVLVATSVGEEGLDIPSTDLVIFYEPVPSDVRSIQRKGRTGRNNTGKVVVMVTKGTADETFRWVSNTKEKKMIKSVTRMKNTGAIPTKQISIPAAGEDKYAPTSQQTLADVILEKEENMGPVVTIDPREKGNSVASVLEHLGASVVWETLPSGRYVVSKKTIVDYFKLDDFVNTLVDSDIFTRLKTLKELVLFPVVIIEGGTISDLAGKRDLSEKVIWNTFTTIAVEYAIPVFFTRDAKESAGLIFTMARRGEDDDTRPRDRKELTIIELLSTIPQITPEKAELLVKEFGTLQALFNATKDELISVEGIDEETASSLLSYSMYRWKKI